MHCGFGTYHWKPMNKAILALVLGLAITASMKSAEPDILWTFETGG